jgi:hypothetical protein
MSNIAASNLAVDRPRRLAFSIAVPKFSAQSTRVAVGMRANRRAYRRAPSDTAVAGVGSEEARSVALALASVRRSNGACSFPALRFHKGTLQA